MPLTTVDPPVNVLDNTTYFQGRVGDDVASVGYYSAALLNGVKVELSGQRHSGFFQHTFPAGGKHILVDLSHYLPSASGGYTSQVYLGGLLTVEPGTNTTQYQGYADYGAGWNEGAPYRVFFCGEFDSSPDKTQFFRGANTDPMVRYHNYDGGAPPQAIFQETSSSGGGVVDSEDINQGTARGARIGVVFSWQGDAAQTIRSRVGISFISTNDSCQKYQTEIPTYSLNDTVDAAVKEWNADVFSTIQVATDDTANTTYLRLLYSSLYFMHLMPSERTGQNPLWKSDEPYWDDFCKSNKPGIVARDHAPVASKQASCGWHSLRSSVIHTVSFAIADFENYADTMWDIFRCTVSLYHLIQPAKYVGMIRSLIDIWRWEGYMPDGRSGNFNGLVQGGSNADNVLADAYVKGLGRNTSDPAMTINWTAGYQAMIKDAEVQPYNTFSPLDQTSSVKEGRGSLYDWIPLGYVSNDRSSRPVSKTVEYALNDYALSVVAAGEGTPADVQKYLNRSAGWQNLWNHDIQHAGFTGFLTPKNSSGAWDSPETYNPAVCGGCEWSDISYEAVPFEYSFVVPHDVETLIQFMGGQAEFERRLDYIVSCSDTWMTSLKISADREPD